MCALYFNRLYRQHAREYVCVRMLLAHCSRVHVRHMHVQTTARGVLMSSVEDSIENVPLKWKIERCMRARLHS